MNIRIMVIVITAFMALTAHGDSCTSDSQCASGTCIVDWMNGNTVGECQALPGATGDGCTRDSDCDNGSCDIPSGSFWGSCSPKGGDSGSVCYGDSECHSDTCIIDWMH